MGGFRVFPENKRRYFGERIASLAEPSPYEAMFQFPQAAAPAPALPPMQVEAPEVSPDPLKEFSEPDTSTLEALEAEAARRPGWKEKLFKYGIPAIGVGLAGLIHGQEGLTGAAAGMNEGVTADLALQEQRKNKLQEDIAAERKRIEDMKRFGIEQAGLEKYRTGQLESKEEIADIRRTQAQNKFEIDKQKNVIAQQRANAYSTNIQSVMQARTADAEQQINELEQRIAHDTSLEQNARDQLSQQLQIAKMNINQRKSEEQGRTDRERMRQEAISGRQKQMIEGGMKPSEVAVLYNNAIKAAQSIGYYDSMDPAEQAELVNNIAASFVQNAAPTLQPGGGSPIMGGLFGNRNAIQAQPPTAAGPGPAGPQTAQPNFPPELLPTLKPGMGTRLDDGSLWTLGPNGQPQMVEPPTQ